MSRELTSQSLTTPPPGRGGRATRGATWRTPARTALLRLESGMRLRDRPDSFARELLRIREAANSERIRDAKFRKVKCNKESRTAHGPSTFPLSACRHTPLSALPHPVRDAITITNDINAHVLTVLLRFGDL